jgi:hypothetical protein
MGSWVVDMFIYPNAVTLEENRKFQYDILFEMSGFIRCGEQSRERPILDRSSNRRKRSRNFPLWIFLHYLSRGMWNAYLYELGNSYDCMQSSEIGKEVDDEDSDRDLRGPHQIDCRAAIWGRGQIQ